MQIWQGLRPPQKEFQGGAITIGNFDGLHRGHQELIARARAVGSPVILMTFDPHPLQILKPEKPLLRIFPRADLVEQLPRFGVDLLVILGFDDKLARTLPEEFWTNCVARPFSPRHVVAGHDFGFGRARSGTLEDLAQWTKSNASELHVVPPLMIDREIVSSRGIREYIRRGAVDAAALRLGRPFYLRGQVGHGAGRGHRIGVPTINFLPLAEVVPAPGVYATRLRWGDELLPSVSNIGFNPTFGGGEGLKIETHVIGRRIEARDLTLDVEFIKRLRGEIKFKSVEDLKNQIKDDILKANEALDNVKPLERR